MGDAQPRTQDIRKKHWRVRNKVEWLNEQKAKHMPLGSRNTSNMCGVNQKSC
jgi:hypothetical protein